MTVSSEQASTLLEFSALCRQRVESRLTKALDQYPSFDTSLVPAMRYASLNGGKRVRPLLMYAAYLACRPGADLAICDESAAAIECIHAYSLVHDDLPAMDDDDLRRGKATCHIEFDEATAILAGDALQCLAFELITGNQNLDAETRLNAVDILSKASGARGMVLGQAIDLNKVDKHISLDELQNMHALKTGALIEAAVCLGANAAKASPAQNEALKRYASAIGLAFQVQDDILDVTSSTETLGKTQGADLARNKPTYVSLLGLDEAKAKAKTLLDEAKAALDDFGDNAHLLLSLADYIIERNH